MCRVLGYVESSDVQSPRMCRTSDVQKPRMCRTTDVQNPRMCRITDVQNHGCAEFIVISVATD